MDLLHPQRVGVALQCLLVLVDFVELVPFGLLVERPSFHLCRTTLVQQWRPSWIPLADTSDGGCAHNL